MIGAIYLTKDFLVELMHQFIAWLPNNGRRAIEISMSFVLHRVKKCFKHHHFTS